MTRKAAFLKDFLSLYFPTRNGKIAGMEADRATFVKALSRLNDLLGERGEKFTFLVVGGGAMVALGLRNATEDIDGILKPSDPDSKRLLYTLADAVQEELAQSGIKIMRGWINLDAAVILKDQGYKASYFEQVPGFTWPNLTLLFAKPEYMLATKVLAHREGSKDQKDIIALLKYTGIRSIESLRDRMASYFDWGMVGNDEAEFLKLYIAIAFPGQTAYDTARLALIERTKKRKEDEKSRSTRLGHRR